MWWLQRKVGVGRQGGTHTEEVRQREGRLSLPWVHLCTLSQGLRAWKKLALDFLVLSTPCPPHPPAAPRPGP